MGHMKRAEERERLLRTKLANSRNIVVKWRTSDRTLLVNFLDPRSRLPLTRQRAWHDVDTIRSLINRSLTPMRPGPAGTSIGHYLQSGEGEAEITVTAEQYAKLLR